MLDLFLKGGVLVYPIALCSLLVLTIFFERLWSLRREKVLPKEFLRKVETMVTEGRVEDARRLCDESYSPIAKILGAALRNSHSPRSAVKEAVEEVGKLQAAELERYVEAIGTCAAISPLLGLLGTVFGMMSVFQDIEKFGLGNPSTFASGIWQALITTAVGLCVAIPAFIFYKYLLSKVDHLILEMEERSLRVIDLLVRKS